MTARVALLTTNLARGGAETQVAQLARAVRAGGWDCAVISLLPPSAFEEELSRAGVPVFSLGMRAGAADPRAAARLAALLRRLRPHVLHAHMFHANILARAIRLICPVPAVVSTVHSAAESPRGSGEVKWRDRVYRLTDRLSDVTVCVSSAAAQRHAAAHAVSRARLRVIPNGVDTQRFRPDPERRARTRRELGLGDKFAWLAVGRLMWKKDYPAMLRAAGEARAGVLLVAGTGPLEAELRAQAKQCGADVRFLGARDDIPALMNACDALALSSVVEGLPMALLEAAASGLPCVATNAGGTQEAVLDGRTGLVVETAGLAAAMRTVSKMPREQRDRMGRAARAHALAHFDMAAVARQWEELYAELLPWM